mmetsp:Transcript_11687/g.20754  ORF Transcript_11687/g.20754 Transcript_11687/m.20754 type:complete len:564 (+) Transcript_11687:10-1701(+)|eukprot:CAMPEP_0119104504 /NCGR_PEP_ID=MMETSP1180-20130426/2701_1 /TAXON_ID=3052 ORGANISM="Chlamydomonas cf sp, Strain CCMP681" /NCGR_SAMPLE_ID=MMETSP1180 /ASSEMBLY_ACC=CAM_ASM_000741 /LENGTH=563 /DNA_ID=CAMNT_0007089285 /DNA_START=16 /DNA_END=1707 /DNA_ORIENTATION=-
MLRSMGRRACPIARQLRAGPVRSLISAVIAPTDYTITTPLYYVNAPPHMGSAYPTIAADTAARYQRLQGRKVRFITGTDEHGEKIALAAAARGLEPKAHCDDIAQTYQDLWKQLDIKYDAFVRTTSPAHEALVVELLKRAWDKDDIYKANYEGWYCVDCEEFKDEKEMVGEHMCPTHRKPCQHRKEDNYFFRLSRYQKEIEALLASDTGFVEPSVRRNELLALTRDGIRDFSITRSAVKWGIKVPQDPEHTVYVWFDALVGYLSGLQMLAQPQGLDAPEGEVTGLQAITSRGWPASVHIIGKDILRFHAMYWPGMLLSAGLPLPTQVFGHGFLTRDGLKMGKALGNTLDPLALVGLYGSDAVRYYLMREIVFGQDGDFSDQRFCDTVNAALANSLGNMLNRVLTLIRKFCDGKVTADVTQIASDHALRVKAGETRRIAGEAYEGLKFNEAAEAVMSLCAAGNQALQEDQPWTALKKGDALQKEQAIVILCAVLETARVAALVLSPITPSLSLRVYSQLGLSESEFQAATWEDTVWGGLAVGQVLGEPKPVFERLVAQLDVAPA